MYKTIKLALNNYPTIPPTLQVAPGTLVSELNVDCARLYHHYYLDCRGFALPNPDPAQFEHLSLLLPCTEFRAIGSGLGAHTAYRQHRSNEFGQAFCRWFLHEHLGITYFAHMETVLNRPPNSNFGGMKVERLVPGDAPDYLCAENTSKVFLAEAKGRHAAVNFNNADFASWRQQFNRVAVKDGGGVAQAVKGHIVATRIATEMNRASVKSTLFAEDPVSPGREPLKDARGLGSMVLALHYSDIAAKIRQPILAASLVAGVPVPDQILFPATVWECRQQAVQGKRFVGGYFPGSVGTLPVQLKDGQFIFPAADLFRLDVAPGTFFGVEESIFKGLCLIARVGDQAAAQLELFPDVSPFYSGISLLRDGSIIGPVEFFNPIERTEY